MLLADSHTGLWRRIRPVGPAQIRPEPQIEQQTEDEQHRKDHGTDPAPSQAGQNQTHHREAGSDHEASGPVPPGQQNLGFGSREPARREPTPGEEAGQPEPGQYEHPLSDNRNVPEEGSISQHLCTVRVSWASGPDLTRASELAVADRSAGTC